MAKYRVWIRDIALQAVVVHANDEKEAELNALNSINGDFDDFAFEDHPTQSLWEVESVEPISE